MRPNRELAAREKQIPPAKNACRMTIYCWLRDLRPSATAAKASQRQKRAPRKQKQAASTTSTAMHLRLQSRRTAKSGCATKGGGSKQRPYRSKTNSTAKSRRDGGATKAREERWVSPCGLLLLLCRRLVRLCRPIVLLRQLDFRRLVGGGGCVGGGLLRAGG
jgi:hypothetical protein